MKNPTGIRIIINSGKLTKNVVFNGLIEDAEEISIRFFLKSQDGTDKVVVQTLISDNNLSFEMQDALENVLSKGNFYIDNGQLKMTLVRTGYKEKLEEKLLSNL